MNLVERERERYIVSPYLIHLTSPDSSSLPHSFFFKPSLFFCSYLALFCIAIPPSVCLHLLLACTALHTRGGSTRAHTDIPADRNGAQSRRNGEKRAGPFTIPASARLRSISLPVEVSIPISVCFCPDKTGRRSTREGRRERAREAATEKAEGRERSGRRDRKRKEKREKRSAREKKQIKKNKISKSAPSSTGGSLKSIPNLLLPPQKNKINHPSWLPPTVHVGAPPLEAATVSLRPSKISV